MEYIIIYDKIDDTKAGLILAGNRLLGRFSGGWMDIADLLGLIVSVVIFIIYSGACIISIIFTFSIETYRKIDELVNLSIMTDSILIPIVEQKINKFDLWAMEHHRFIGALLIIFSLLNLKLAFSLVNSF